MEDLIFPPVELSEPNGLLAVGGDLSPGRLLLAYHSGIFPWPEGTTILWWSPDPRFVLFPDDLKVSKSMQRIIQQNSFDFTINKNFSSVINNCKTVSRKDQPGTWITEDMKEAYNKLHEQGYAHSAEAWIDNNMVGGLYGIRLGDIFFGESMFSTVSNASKFVFIKYVEQLKQEGVKLIDCQVYTKHLESLGAGMVPRKMFLAYLEKFL